MAQDIDTIPPGLSPGGGPDSMRGWVIPVPLGTVSVDTLVISRDCWLMGWSLRESTGAAGAIVELLSGSSSNGELVAEIGLGAGFDPVASQTPAAQSSSGGNAAQVASIGGVAGTTAFVQTMRITGEGATAGSTVVATLTGVLGGTISYPVTVPAGATVVITPVFDSFGTRGLQASATGQAIALNLPAFGAGNTLEEASITGYVGTAAGNSSTQAFGDLAPYCRGGVFLHVVAGSVRGAIYVRI